MLVPDLGDVFDGGAERGEPEDRDNLCRSNNRLSG
jgi:hypothetical protein